MQDERTIDMGTEINDLTIRAWHLSSGLTQKQKTNRHTLLAIMTIAGFSPIESEWWHYELPNSVNRFEIFDSIGEN